MHIIFVVKDKRYSTVTYTIILGLNVHIYN